MIGKYRDMSGLRVSNMVLNYLKPPSEALGRVVYRDQKLLAASAYL